MKQILLLLLIVSLFVRCTNDTTATKFRRDDGLGAFDVTSDDRQIVLSYSMKGKASLYTYLISESKLELFQTFKDEVSLLNPKCSNNGKKVAFISNKEGSLASDIWIVNAEGGEPIRLVKSNALISEIAFSKNDEVLYYCSAKEYKSYSPLATKSAHDFDIYSVHIKDKKIEKISALNAYGLSNISDFNNDNILLSLTAEGIFYYKKGTTSELIQIKPRNKGEKNANSYSRPVLVNPQLIGFVSYYNLFVLDLTTMDQKLIFSANGRGQFNNLSSYKKKNSLLFSLSDETNKLNSIDLNTGTITQFQIKIKN